MENKNKKIGLVNKKAICLCPAVSYSLPELEKLAPEREFSPLRAGTLDCTNISDGQRGRPATLLSTNGDDRYR